MAQQVAGPGLRIATPTFNRACRTVSGQRRAPRFPRVGVGAGLSRVVRWNTTAPDSCAVPRRTEDMVVELADGCSDPRIE
jgi:hypothetical protein